MKIRPMVHVFEQNVPLDNLDALKDFPSALNASGQKRFFRRALYKGCPPRVFSTSGTLVRVTHII